MLKVTVVEQNGRATFKVEGRLVKPWAGELKKSWAEWTRKHPEEAVTVDLSEVSFIDSEGKVLLAVMFRKGAELSGGGFLTRSIVEVIKSERG